MFSRHLLLILLVTPCLAVCLGQKASGQSIQPIQKHSPITDAFDRKLYRKLGRPELLEIVNRSDGPSKFTLLPRIYGHRIALVFSDSLDGQLILKSYPQARVGDGLVIEPITLNFSLYRPTTSVHLPFSPIHHTSQIDCIPEQLREERHSWKGLKGSYILLKGGHLGPIITKTDPDIGKWYYGDAISNPPELSSKKDLTDLNHRLKLLVPMLNSFLLESDEAQPLLTGEVKIQKNSLLGGSDEIPCMAPIRELDPATAEIKVISAREAVIRIVSKKNNCDSYLFFVKDGDWKLTAVRTPLEGRRIADGTDEEERSIDASYNA